MVKNHLKRLNTPRTWNILRKENKFIVRPNPGANNMELSVPITVFFKELVKKAQTTKEVKFILREKEVFVNGIRKRDNKVPVGFLDVISIPSIDDHYRILLSKKNKLFALPIDKKEADLLLLKIQNKILLGKDKIQLNFANGFNLLVKKDTYKTGDSLVVSASKRDILDHLPLQKGAKLLLFGGKHNGSFATFEELKGDSLAVCKFDNNKGTHDINKRFILVVGKDKQVITLEEKKK